MKISLLNLTKRPLRSSTLVLWTAAWVLGASPLHAEASYQLDPKTSQLEFTAIGKPGFLRINGKGAQIAGQAKVAAQETTGQFVVKLDQFVTGIDLRDQHMKDTYLETKKFPEAKLTWKIAATKVQKDGQEVPFTGTLSLHGVEKPIGGTATLTASPDLSKVEGEAQFQIKLSDYKIKIPSYLGVTVAEDVDVKAIFFAAATPVSATPAK